MSKSYIIDAVRSPIGLKNGKMIGIRPDDLSANLIKVLIYKREFKKDYFLKKFGYEIFEFK